MCASRENAVTMETPGTETISAWSRELPRLDEWLRRSGSRAPNACVEGGDQLFEFGDDNLVEGFAAMLLQSCPGYRSVGHCDGQVIEAVSPSSRGAGSPLG